MAVLLTIGTVASFDALQEFDDAITDFTRSWADSLGWPVDVAHVVSELTGPVPATIFATIAAVALFATRFRAAAVYVALSSISGALVVEITKLSVGRSRPPGAEAYQQDLEKSFPSGHSAGGIYLYLVLGLVLWRIGSANGRPWLRWIGAALVVFGPFIGVCRLILGVHWPTDIVAGWAFGSIAALAVALVLWQALASGWRPGAQPPPPPSTPQP